MGYSVVMRLLIVLILSLSLMPVGVEAKKSKGKKRPTQVASTGFEQRPEVKNFIEEMGTLGLDSKALRQRFSSHRPNTDVIRLMDAPVLRPAQWHEYYPRFLQEARIEAGVNYVRTHAAWFKRAQEVYQVPPPVIAAIIGVETFYGRVTGSNEVFNALATLCFDYPRRSVYFCGELKEYLLHQKADPTIYSKAKGSYAGAMGLPQFMPSSIKNFAVDFDSDGHIDLWNSHADIIGSVANYFAGHGWDPKGQVMLPVRLGKPDLLDTLKTNPSERQAIAKWIEAGVEGEALTQLLPLESASLLMLEEASGPQYFLALNNFYVITRYNRSRLYASVVWSMAVEIEKRLK